MDPHQQTEISKLTEAYGGEWGFNHTQRLLKLVEMIAQDTPYNQDIVWTAAHLHDWGAYPAWAQNGVDHALRSEQVARSFLTEHGFAAEFIDQVAECIIFHHQSGQNSSPEALLLRDADALDFLGAVGVLRDFSKQPKELRKAFKVVTQRKEQLKTIFHYPKAQEIARQRLQETESLLAAFEAESFGYF
jgi:uncharacterized protein